MDAHPLALIYKSEHAGAPGTKSQPGSCLLNSVLTGLHQHLQVPGCVAQGAITPPATSQRLGTRSILGTVPPNILSEGGKKSTLWLGISQTVQRPPGPIVPKEPGTKEGRGNSNS